MYPSFVFLFSKLAVTDQWIIDLSTLGPIPGDDLCLLFTSFWTSLNLFLQSYIFKWAAAEGRCRPTARRTSSRGLGWRPWMCSSSTAKPASGASTGRGSRAGRGHMKWVPPWRIAIIKHGWGIMFPSKKRFYLSWCEKIAALICHIHFVCHFVFELLIPRIVSFWIILSLYHIFIILFFRGDVFWKSEHTNRKMKDPASW